MRGASKQSLSCSEFSAFDFSGCVAHPTTILKLHFLRFSAVITSSGCVVHQYDAWRIHPMRGASDINKSGKR